MKRKNIIIITAFITLIGAISLLYYCKNVYKTKTNENNKTIAVYVEGDSGEYTSYNSKKFPTDGYVLNTEKSYCVNGSVLSQDENTKSISVSVSRSDQCKLYFDIETYTSKSTLKYLGLTLKSGSPTYSSVATTNQTSDGLYATEDDYGTSYYFRGNVTNNYVKFAGFYWRIIRINGDGTVRMIYDGTSAYANGVSKSDRLALTSVAWNSSYNDAKYVGYMYGGASGSASTTVDGAQKNETDSNIKTQLDAWYETNIKEAGYSQYVADEIFCNDRSISSGPGYGSSSTATYYSSMDRLYTNKSPSLKCSQKNDAFTVDDEEKGNGNLTYPIGLITSDEISIAGGVFNTNNTSYYLYKGSWYWSFSPYDFNSGSGRARVFSVGSSGGISNTYVGNAGGIAPVINLTAETANSLVGSGTMTDPYKLQASLISFTIDGTTYYAEEDMTWSKWVNSTFNTSTTLHLSYDSTNMYMCDGFISIANSSSIIIANSSYPMTIPTPVEECDSNFSDSDLDSDLGSSSS